MFFPALQGQTPPWFHLKKPATSLLQVDELKAKLATQEVELRQKNEDADKLIQVVGVESDPHLLQQSHYLNTYHSYAEIEDHSTLLGLVSGQCQECRVAFNIYVDVTPELGKT